MGSKLAAIESASRFQLARLAPGEYQMYVSLASQAGRDGHVVDAPGIVASFTMSDDTTMRGNLRAGYFSTILGWDISP